MKEFTVKGSGGMEEEKNVIVEGGSSRGNGMSLGAPSGQRRRAQSKSFTLTDLRTDDNLSVSSSGELLRTARYKPCC